MSLLAWKMYSLVGAPKSVASSSATMLHLASSYIRIRYLDCWRSQKLVGLRRLPTRRLASVWKARFRMPLDEGKLYIWDTHSDTTDDLLQLIMMAKVAGFFLRSRRSRGWETFGSGLESRVPRDRRKYVELTVNLR